jgi:hypothetical protein
VLSSNGITSFVHKLQTTKIKDFVMFILYNQLKLVIGLKSKAFYLFYFLSDNYMFKEIGHILQGLHLSFAFGYNSIRRLVEFQL